MRTSTFLLALCGAASLGFAQTPCEKLQALQPADAVFTKVEMVLAGPVPAPAGRGNAPAAAAAAPAGRGGRGAAAPPMLPAYCHVAATLKPSSDSVIKMEL